MDKLTDAILKKKSAANYEKVPQNVRDENEKRLTQYKTEREELQKCADELSKLS